LEGTGRYSFTTLSRPAFRRSCAKISGRLIPKAAKQTPYRKLNPCDCPTSRRWKPLKSSCPLLNQRLGVEAWIKHENHTPVGAFKLRGGLLYVTWLKETVPGLTTVVAATRGNHGQGVAMAARLLGLQAIIVVPHGNSREKNLAMKAQGAQLIEHGDDFQAALEYARELAAQPGRAIVESLHPKLVEGTSTYALEFFRASPAMETVYVPIGLGSSICGVCAARNALGLATKVVGVVSSESPSYSVSFRERRVVEIPSNTKIADGLACRLPNASAMSVIWEQVERIIEVSDAEIAAAMRAYYEDTHNLSEGAAAAALAGALKDRARAASTSHAPIGIVLTGGNVDREVFARVLTEDLLTEDVQTEGILQEAV
jgi:threonine dehydratase